MDEKHAREIDKATLDAMTTDGIDAYYECGPASDPPLVDIVWGIYRAMEAARLASEDRLPENSPQKTAIPLGGE